MLNWFKKNNSKSEDSTAAAAATRFAPGTEVSYSPQLIQKFEGVHTGLRKTFNKIEASATSGEFADTARALKAFRQGLTAHLLEENIKLYTYLTKCLAHDSANHQLMVQMKSEMGEIGRKVMQFLNHHIEHGVTAETRPRFLEELHDIGAIFTERMKNEESLLYTMYMPPDAY